jgi:DNA/RNA endonuclease YhcR with UshA esterase domain
MTAGDNFGMIVVNWEVTPPTVRLQVRDVSGEIAFQQKFELPLLTPGAAPIAVAAKQAPSPQPAAAPKTAGAITVAEAISKVGEKVTVEFKVKATGQTMDGVRVFLNSTQRRDDAENFTVVLMMRDIGDALKAAGVSDAPNYYKNKTVRVTGSVALFREKPQIVVDDVTMIAVVP